MADIFWTITSRGHWNFEPRMVSSILDLVSKHLHWTNQYWASYVPQVNNPQSVLGFLFWCLKTGLKRPDVELNTSCESGLILSGVDRSREALPAPASNNATCFSLDSSTNLILQQKWACKVQVTRKVFSQWISACCDYDPSTLANYEHTLMSAVIVKEWRRVEDGASWAAEDVPLTLLV